MFMNNERITDAAGSNIICSRERNDMNESYQLTLSADEDFQSLIDTLYARLSILPNIRVSKRRIVNAGILSLRTAEIGEIADLASRVNIPNTKVVKNLKHKVIQVDLPFADLARFVGARMAVEHGFRKHTRYFMHYGIMSLADCTDEQFEFLVRASEDYEANQPVMKITVSD